MVGRSEICWQAPLDMFLRTMHSCSSAIIVSRQMQTLPTSGIGSSQQQHSRCRSDALKQEGVEATTLRNTYSLSGIILRCNAIGAHYRFSTGSRRSAM